MSRLFGNLVGRVGGLMVAAAGAGIVAETCLYNVDAGHRGLIFDRIKGQQESERQRRTARTRGQSGGDSSDAHSCLLTIASAHQV